MVNMRKKTPFDDFLQKYNLTGDNTPGGGASLYNIKANEGKAPALSQPLKYSQEKALENASSTYYSNHPDANPNGPVSNSSSTSNQDITQVNIQDVLSKLKALNRQGYPYPADPSTYSRTSQMKKLASGDFQLQDASGNPTGLITPDEAKLLSDQKATASANNPNNDNPYFQEQDRQAILARYKENPNNVSVTDLLFLTGRTPTRNAKLPWTVTPNYGDSTTPSKKVTDPTTQNDIKINSVNKDAGYHLQDSPDLLQQANPNALLMNKSDLSRLSTSEQNQILQAQKDGKKSIMIQYNGMIHDIPIDQATNYINNPLYKTWYDVQLNHKNPLGTLRDGFKNSFDTALSALGTVQQGVEGAYKGFNKSTGINVLKANKPIFDATLPLNDSTQQIVNALMDHQSLKDTQIGQDTQSALNEIKSWGDKAKKADWGNVLKQTYQGAKTGVQNSLNGQYAFHGGQTSGADLLKNEGYDNNLRTNLLGLGLDVISGITPSAGGKQVLMKGGKVVNAKNIDKAVQYLQKAGMNVSGSNADGQLLINKITDLVKQNGHFTPQQADQAINDIKQAHFKDYMQQQLTTPEFQAINPAKKQDAVKKIVDAYNAPKGEGAILNTGLNQIKNVMGNAITRNKGISYAGQELIPSEAIAKAGNKVANLPGIKQTVNAIGNSAPVQKFHQSFNVTHNVPQMFQDLVHNTQGNIHLDQQNAANDLKQLTKGWSNKDNVQNAKNWVDPATYQATSKMDPASQQALQDFSNRSYQRDLQYNPDLPFRPNYLKGIYQGKEKDITKIFPDYFNRAVSKPSSHKAKTYDNMLQAGEQNKNLKPLINLPKQLYNREAQSIDWASRKGLEQQVNQLNSFNPELANNTHAQNYMQNFLNPVYKPKGAIQKGISNVNNLTKSYLLNVFPATAMRNVLGGTQNNVQDGSNLDHFWNALKGTFGTKNTKVNVGGQQMTKAEFKDLATKAGVNQTMQNTDLGINPSTDFGSGVKHALSYINPTNQNFIAFQPARALQNIGERFNRNVAVLNNASKYGANDVGAISQGVRNAHFDYNPHTGLTPFEANVVREAIPFYSFMRHNLPFQAKQLVQNPSQYNFWVNQMPNAVNNANGHDVRKDTVNVPDYAQSYLNLGKGQYLPMNWSSTNDFQTWNDPVTKITSGLQPIIKAAVDGSGFLKHALGSDFSVQGNQPTPFDNKTSAWLLQNHPTIANAIGLTSDKNSSGATKYSIDGHKGQVLKDLIPQLSNVENVVKTAQGLDPNASAMDKAKQFLGADKIINLLTGLGKKSIDPGITNYYAAKNDQFDSNQTLQNLINTGKLVQDPNASKTAQQKPPSIYDMERAYLADKKFTDTIDQRKAQGQEKNPYKTSATVEINGKPYQIYNTKEIHDLNGNTVGYIQTKAPSKHPNDFTKKLMDALNQKVAEGQAKSKKDMAMYYDMKKNPVTFKKLWQQEGIQDPTTDLYKKTLYQLQTGGN